jgi:hypothetical protein
MRSVCRFYRLWLTDMNLVDVAQREEVNADYIMVACS